MIPPNTLLQNRYLVVKQLGQGGMGAVFEAVDQRFGSTVALKMMTQQGDALLRAFEREARLLNSLRHTALPVVIDYFAESTGQFLVMQYIPGEDLAQRLFRNGTAFPQEDVIRWALQLLNVLDYLHTRQPPIVHRDIKPQNLKLSPEGDIILLDFGLAKGGSGSVTKTTASLLGYTPFYASLEQIRGLTTDARSDLYSLAATLHHLATGSVPVDALSRADTILQGQSDPLVPAHLANPAVDPVVSELLRRTLALNRAERPSTAAEMRSMLDAALRARVTAPQFPPAPPVPQTVAPPATQPPPSDYTTNVMQPGVSTDPRPNPTVAPDTSATLEMPGLPGVNHTMVAPKTAPQPPPTAHQVVPATNLAPIPPDAEPRGLPWLPIAGGVALMLGGVTLLAVFLLPQLWTGQPTETPADPSAKPPAAAAAPVFTAAPALTAPFAIYDIAVTPDGNTIATAGDSQSLALVAPGGGPARLLGGATERCRSVAVAKTGRIVAGSDDGLIRVWESAEAAEAPVVLTGHEGGTHLVRLSEDGATVASAGYDKTVRLWSASGGPSIASLKAPRTDDLVVTIQATTRTVAYLGSDRSVQIWSIAEARKLAEHPWRGRDITAGAFSADGLALALGDKGGAVRIIDATTGALVSVLEGPDAEVGSITFSPDGSLVAAGFGNGTVRVWSTRAGAEVATLTGHKRFVVAVAFGHDGKTLAAADEAMSIRTWRT